MVSEKNITHCDTKSSFAAYKLSSIKYILTHEIRRALNTFRSTTDVVEHHLALKLLQGILVFATFLNNSVESVVRLHLQWIDITLILRSIVREIIPVICINKDRS